MPKHKRFHQSRRDRMHESEGMMRHEEHMLRGRMRGMHEGFREKDEYGVKRSVAYPYSNEYGMRHGSGGMIDEDHREVANLPQHVVYRPYGDPVGYLPQEIDDTIYGIDGQRDLDYRKARENWYPKKV